MKTLVLALIVALIPALARADGSLLRFQGGIGVDPVSGISSGAPVANVVRGTAPGGTPWRIAELRAEVGTDGQIQVEGRGLILAGGDGIGTAPALNVVAILFCGVVSPTPDFNAFTSSAVALPPNGDFRIDSTLSPTPPNPCVDPVLLIAAGVGGVNHWLAAGIPRTGTDDNQ